MTRAVTNGAIIREERESDRAGIAAVHPAAFGQEDENRIVERLRGGDDFLPELSLVAVEDGAVVGHVILSRGRLEGRPALALGPIGVLPAEQDRGVGAALMDAALERARAAGEDVVVLLGHPAYYARFGFAPASRLGITPEVDFPDEAFMALELRPGGAGAGGRFVYPGAFGLG